MQPRTFCLCLLLIFSLCLAASPAAAAVIETQYNQSDHVLYDEHAALPLKTVFDPSEIPSSKNLTLLREELGRTLYTTAPALHEEIISAYQARYPNLSGPDGSTRIDIYGCRLQITFSPDGIITAETSSVYDLFSLHGEKLRTASKEESSSDKGAFFGRPSTNLSIVMVFEYDGVNPPIPHPVLREHATGFTNWTEEGVWSTRNFISEKILSDNSTTYAEISLEWNRDKKPKDLIAHIVRFTCTPEGHVSSFAEKMFITLDDDATDESLSALMEFFS
ncbi:hypothetical protein [Methanorbis rubei]|uniref:Uncharacterized protein n=1 Tax=Methanorbis rubei TaxID=3028300 RepID=A0AAE4MFB8_9EURY|nr:hypothetical protein [Methanocorpusculaceae archaeon Cs1]